MILLVGVWLRPRAVASAGLQGACLAAPPPLFYGAGVVGQGRGGGITAHLEPLPQRCDALVLEPGGRARRWINRAPETVGAANPKKSKENREHGMK